LRVYKKTKEVFAMVTNDIQDFNLEDARNYWKFAPSALGKVDTSKLLELNDEEFKKNIYPHLASRFFFASEDIPLINHFCELFQGKRVVAIGSGIGHEEIQFLKAGAEVICTDIVETNLKVIERTCALEGFDQFSYIHIKDPATMEFPENIDYVWGRGVLQAMPFPIQIELMKQLKKNLKRDGGMIFSIYREAFVKQTHDTTDPKVFARYSDPSVGDCHNPWSEWYDDEKMEELIGSDMHLAHKQIWGQDRCAWYEIAWGAKSDPTTPPDFLDLSVFENSINLISKKWNLADFEVAEAELSIDDGQTLSIETKKSNYHYAALSPVVEINTDEGINIFDVPDKLSVSVNLKQGGMALGVLDVDRDEMIVSKTVLEKGFHTHYFYLNVTQWPRRYRLVISNFCPNADLANPLLNRPIFLDILKFTRGILRPQ